MDTDQIIGEVKRYDSELAGILSRFKSDRSGIHIASGDDPIFRQYVHELVDLFNDVLGQNSYSHQIVAEFNEGVSNFVRSPSFKSVENILLTSPHSLAHS